MKIYANMMVYNELPFLDHVVEVLLNFYDHIILMDNGSTDGSREWIKRSRDKVTAVLNQQEDPPHYSNLRNKMLRAVPDGAWVLKWDPDELPSHGMMNDLRAFLEADQGQHRMGSALVSPREKQVDLSAGRVREAPTHPLPQGAGHSILQSYTRASDLTGTAGNYRAEQQHSVHSLESFCREQVQAQGRILCPGGPYPFSHRKQADRPVDHAHPALARPHHLSGQRRVAGRDQKGRVISMLKLNLGAGTRPLDGYINIDIKPECEPDIVGDVCALPFESKTVDEIRLDAVFEHIYHHKRLGALREWHQVLKHGGKLVINWIPDFEALLSLYGGPGPNDDFPHFDIVMARRMLYGKSTDEPSLHKDCFSAQKIEEELEVAGYDSVEVRRVTWPGDRLDMP